MWTREPWPNSPTMDKLCVLCCRIFGTKFHSAGRFLCQRTRPSHLLFVMLLSVRLCIIFIRELLLTTKLLCARTAPFGLSVDFCGMAICPPFRVKGLITLKFSCARTWEDFVIKVCRVIICASLRAEPPVAMKLLCTRTWEAPVMYLDMLARVLLLL